ncbi:hypothetical protein [Halobaculum rubrum]|uniref:hypothetical protein n=1 Tax=Halobaculum rubrum TaxID=2872158 RepID=UPI001CA3F4D6|nr:hypothetical protein [Halobaculum rubrum]QZY00565.1 hypothetical protein K6T25_05655 [Halobaculum rubrum]
MAAKQPAVGIDHVTVVPTNADTDDERPTVDSDEKGTAGRDGNDNGDSVESADDDA